VPRGGGVKVLGTQKRKREGKRKRKRSRPDIYQMYVSHFPNMCWFVCSVSETPLPPKSLWQAQSGRRLYVESLMTTLNWKHCLGWMPNWRQTSPLVSGQPLLPPPLLPQQNGIINGITFPALARCQRGGADQVLAGLTLCSVRLCLPNLHQLHDS
jgi:hypothetical protein